MLKYIVQFMDFIISRFYFSLKLLMNYTYELRKYFNFVTGFYFMLQVNHESSHDFLTKSFQFYCIIVKNITNQGQFDVLSVYDITNYCTCMLTNLRI